MGCSEEKILHVLFHWHLCFSIIEFVNTDHEPLFEREESSRKNTKFEVNQSFMLLSCTIRQGALSFGLF